MLSSLLPRRRRRRRRRRQGDRARARHRARRARRRCRPRQHLRLDDPGGRPAARAARRADGHPVARLRARRGGRLLRPDRRPARLRPHLIRSMLNLLAQTAENDDEGGSGLIEVVPGLMIWTLICFGIAFFVLRKYAFGPIQKTIDERRNRIRQAVEEADNARNEARELLEQNRADPRAGTLRVGRHPRRGAQGRATRRSSARSRRPRPSASGASRTRASRSRRRRSARSARSAPRSPT